jgi:hypothetical protein
MIRRMVAESSTVRMRIDTLLVDAAVPPSQGWQVDGERAAVLVHALGAHEPAVIPGDRGRGVQVRSVPLGAGTAVHPDAATVEVDGHLVGRAHQFVASPLSLGPGIHRVDVAYPGFKPVRTVVDVSGQQVYLLRATLEPDGEPSEPPGSGYFVVPRP